MPTSVLLAVLAAAGLLALAPALVRRHDATERQVAERAQSTARVLTRQRRPRSVPGKRPVNPSRVTVPTVRIATPRNPRTANGAGTADTDRTDAGAAGAGHGNQASGGRYIGRVRQSPYERADAWERRNAARAQSATSRLTAARSAPPARRRVRSASPGRRPRRRTHTSAAVYRRRRVLLALVLLNLVELVGLVTVGPGFWVGLAVTGTLLVSYLAYLRNLAVVDQRRRRAEARRAAQVAARQAAVRREQERRAAARREAARRAAAQRESLRRAGASWSAPPTVSYRPANRHHHSQDRSQAG